MTPIVGALLGLVAIANLVFFIMVLIRLAKEKGALHCILGILCGLYTFIWGWINGAQLGFKKIMIYWTVGLILHFVLYGILMGSLASQGAFNLPQEPTATEPATQE